ncbi:MAG: hypothetical protein WC304_04275 [Candidatus Gracilibacteria bacterium]|jgi:hypothetical protein
MKVQENPVDSPEEIAVREEIAAGNLDNALLLIKEIEETDLCDEMFYLIAIAFMQDPYRNEASARKVERRIQNPQIKAECAAAVTAIKDGFLLQRVKILSTGGEIRSAKIVAAAIQTPELKAQAEEFLPREEKKVVRKEIIKPSVEVIATRATVRKKLSKGESNAVTKDNILLGRIKALDRDIRDEATLRTMNAIVGEIKSPEKKAIAEAIRDGVHEEADDATFHC